MVFIVAKIGLSEAMVLFDLKPEISEAILDCLPRLMYWFNGPALFVSCGLFNLCFSFLLSSNKLSDLVRFYYNDISFS